MSYSKIIERVFLDRYHSGDVEVDFIRGDLVEAAKALGVSMSLHARLYASGEERTTTWFFLNTRFEMDSLPFWLRACATTQMLASGSRIA